MEPLLIQLRDLRAELGPVEARMRTVVERTQGNGHGLSEGLKDLRQRAQTLMATIEERIRTITSWGVLIKDVETGLVDFPALVGGEEIYLCWRLGEPRIAWWHTPESGFAGRQPLVD